ncbi:MAG: GSCFA domain-containing protein [Bacteroidales bacterium]|nr:GSCFA domain-containing protein [Bacteroidales bacterium]
MDLRGRHTLMTGSCFATEIGARQQAEGCDITLNPFGVLYNPASIAAAIERMETGMPFTEKDVIRRVDDASKGLVRYVSYFHHGSFARETPEAFLENANARLREACAAFEAADTCIITLGTAWVFRLAATGEVVANCHKVPARDFRRELMSVSEIEALLAPLVERHPEKQWIFTVSPIRHLADTAHGNQISKSILLLAIDALQKRFPEKVLYFPAYEIMIDELRDYRWYSPDNKTHPTDEAVEVILERFKEF